MIELSSSETGDVVGWSFFEQEGLHGGELGDNQTSFDG